MKKKGKFEAERPAKAASAHPAAKPTAAENNTAPKKAKAKKASGGVGKKIAIAALCVVVLAAAGACAYGMALKNGDSIYPNVYVAGVNVGGLKRDAAVVSVEEAVAQSFKSDTLTVVFPDRSIALDPEVTQVALNADEAVDAAMAHGREGGPISALVHYLRAKNSEYSVDLESSLNLDTAYIRQVIDQTARDVACEKIDPKVDVDEEAGTITVRTGSPAVSLDADALYDTVLNRFAVGDFSDLSFEYDTEPCDSVDLQSYYDKYCTEMVDAYYDEETKQLVAEQNGYGFDLPYYTQQIALAEPGETIIIQMEDLIPEVTLEQLKSTYFSQTFAKLDTPHTADASRTKNLELACKAINGTILNPGDVFSFNNIVGERTAAKGYLGAIVYTTGGKSEAQEGGGVCQVASTIYSCCLMSGLEVLEREPHMYAVTYVEPGMDATIYWGSLDFKFKNSTEYPMRIDASVSGGYVHIAFVGTAPEHPDYDHIKLRGVTVSTKDWKTVIAGTSTPITIVPGGGKDANGKSIDLAVDNAGNKYVLDGVEDTAYTGKTVQAYLDYCDANGKVIKSELIHTDVYRSRDKSYKATPYVDPEPEEPEEPTDPTDPTPTPEPTPEPTPDPAPEDPGEGEWW